MNFSNVKLESLYEIKCTRRNVLFNIFVLFAILGVIFLPFFFFPGGERIKIGQLKLPWSGQALSSSIPFMTAYYYNFIQMLLVIFMASNDLRRYKLTAMSALDTHSQYNIDVITGRFTGRMIVFSLVNILVFIIAICYNIIYYPHVFNLFFYLFYWITLTFPALVYFLGLSALVTRWINNQGISVLCLLVLGGGATLCGSLVHILDPLARYVPNLFSDFTGHPCLYPYLLHRIIYLFAGISLLVISTLACKRVSNSSHPIRTNLLIASIPLMVLIITLSLYCSYFGVIKQNENKYRQLYLKYDNTSKPRILTHDIVWQEASNSGFSAESKMKIVNRNSKPVPVILYLNPGLQVNKLKYNNIALSYKRDGQVIIVDKMLEPEDTCKLVMNYEGIIDKAVCHLDISSSKRDSPDVNSLGIFCYGNQPAYCTENYKLLTPECLWYPVCVPPTCFRGSRVVNFTRYSLVVLHDSLRTVISQGNVIEPQTGKTIFHQAHDLQGISLCMGNYEKRSLVVDSVRMEIYYAPGHEYILSGFDMDTTTLIEELKNRKTQFELQECIQNRDFHIQQLVAQQSKQPLDKDYTQQFPYTWLRLVETPLNFNCFKKNDEIDGEMVHQGLAFLPEKLATFNYDFFKSSKDTLDFLATRYLNILIDKNLIQGRYNLLTLMKGQLNYVSSETYPMINEISQNVLKESSWGISNTENDYYMIKYMQGHSLIDAINDNNLSSAELRTLIRNKSRELFALICSQISASDFSTFYHEFFSSYRFRDVSERDFIDSFYANFQVNLDSILVSWYNRKKLPSYKIDAKCHVYQSSQDDNIYYYFYKVYNNSDVDGVVLTTQSECWSIPKHSCKGIYIKKTQYSGNVYSLELPMSQNLPVITKYKDFEPVHTMIDLPEGIFESDSNYFKTDDSEIIVSVLDPGSKLLNSTTWFRSISNYITSDAKIYGFVKERDNQWKFDISSNYYGFPVQGAYYKPNGKGNNHIEWNVELHQDGDYELFFYNAIFSKARRVEYEKTLHFDVYDGKTYHDVEITVNDSNVGWVSIGKYELMGNEAKIILHDIQDFMSNSPFKTTNVIIANAVKLRKITRMKVYNGK